MPFADIPDRGRALELLQRSLLRGRVAHAYLFAGPQLPTLETVARALVMAVNCTNPPAQTPDGQPDSCGSCPACRRIATSTHPDVLWVRPESKLRVITIQQVREVIQTVSLKPTEALWKAAVIVGADRMNPQAANAFLKTLEEPPGQSILILLATEPQRLLETILSRCLRLDFWSNEQRHLHQTSTACLPELARDLAEGNAGLLRRYHLLSRLSAHLTDLRSKSLETQQAQSPLGSHDDIDPHLRQRWEDELAAAAEAEYRRLRAEVLSDLQWFFRDVWLKTLNVASDLLALPNLESFTAAIAKRIGSADAQHNLATITRARRMLETNVQEALVLEVSLLNLKL